MCGRFGLSRPDRLHLDRLGLSLPAGLAPRLNISPGTTALVARAREGHRELVELRWGLVLPGTGRGPLVNVRSEGAYRRPGVSGSMRRRRCLVPADVFYEWQDLPGSRVRQPWALALPGREPFALGGVWEPEVGEGPATFAVLTTAPNTVVAPIHDRMPVIIPPESWADWLDPRMPEPRIRELSLPWSSDRLEAWPVSRRVNRPDAEDPDLLAPVEPQRPAEALELF